MRESKLELARAEKLAYVEERVNPYPERFERSHEIKEAALLPDGTDNVSTAGRILFMRKMGRLTFLTIQDIEGRLQIAVKQGVVGEDAYEFLKKGFDLGDFIGARGSMFTTQTGEKTLEAEEIVFLGKALKPLPEKFHGLNNQDSCYRQRYLDMIMNESTRARFRMKIAFVREMRRYLEDHGYMEIETPVLTDHPSGATARPFSSHHNALDMDVFLRIAPETYLKRAIVGGFTKVFEVARCFRNEGMDASHLQDFTMIEGYCAYYNYRDNMVFLQKMLRHIVTKLYGSPQIQVGDQALDFGGTWEEVTFRELILRDSGIDIDSHITAATLLQEIREKDIELESETPLEHLGKGNLMDLLYKKVSRPKIKGPTFLLGHPTAISPLARSSDENPAISDRFQLLINGAEVINAYSELVDPKLQRQRLMEQAALKAGGDEEAMVMDHDYLLAMEYGMPPISGWGMGLDRVIQVLTGQDNIKDSVYFPLMRPLGEPDLG